MIRRTSLVILFLLCAVPVRAEETLDYAAPTWANLLRTMVHFNALDLSDNTLLDEYAAVTDCDVYKASYGDDFKWNAVRQAIRDDVEQNRAHYPAAYAYDIRLRLDRYDFANRLFVFSDKTPVRNINAIPLYTFDSMPCNNVRIRFIPGSFRAVLVDQPVDIPGLPLTPEEGQALLKRMAIVGNNQRFVYAEFNLHVIYIDQLRHGMVRVPGDFYRFDSRSGLVDFYEDENHTRPIYSYRPPPKTEP